MKTKFSVLVVLCLVVTMFSGCLTGFAAEMPEVTKKYSYADVGESHWAYPWVTYMTERDYIHGYPAAENGGLDMYKPDQWITRAEFVTILYFMLRGQGHMTESFTDLKTTDWHYPYIDKAVVNGYMSGYGDGTVRPNAYITREEASSVVYRAFKIGKYANETTFADGDQISGWAYEAVMSLADLGIVVGYTGEDEKASYIQPKVNIKRAEVASLLANADKFYPATVQLGDEEVEYSSVAGGKKSFDMFPKNTSDSLSVSIKVAEDVKYTVTYTKDGTVKTVTPEDFEKVIFTAQELEKANVTVNFPDAKPEDKVTVTVSVTDKGGAADRVVGSRVYEIEFEHEPLQGGGNGGTSVVKHKVEYIINGTPATPEEVVNGNRPTSVPMPDDKSMEYVWTDGTNTVNPAFVTITDDITFTTDGTTQKRDRVVESLKGYQSMKGKGFATKTVKVLDADEVDSSLLAPNSFLNNKWWTNDMLEVIVTNDRDNYAEMFNPDKDNLIKKEYPDEDEDKLLKPIYDDVARYVVDNSTYFSEAPIDSTTKSEYVLYFRAMVRTIDAAANDAIVAYQDARAIGTVSKEEAYDMFLVAAVTGATNSLNTSIEAEALGDEKKAELATLAAGYLTKMVESMAPAGTADGQKFSAGLGSIKTYLEGIYGDPNFANLVKAKIASSAIYTKSE